MKKVGIVSCNKFINKIEEDIILVQQLKNINIDAKLISWQDNKINYKEYNCLILKSVWGYQNNLKEFMEWLYMLEKNNIKILNDTNIIKNNIRKDIQTNILDKNNIPHIKSQFIKSLDDLNKLKCLDEYIVKPIISGSGDNTFLVGEKKISNLELSSLLINLINSNQIGLIVQPFISDIKKGEYACVFVENENTHNMMRNPGIFFEKKKPYYLNEVPDKILELAYRVNKLKEFKDSLYMRVDIVDIKGEPSIMEVELTEPDLLTKFIPEENKKNKILSLMANKIERRI
ncbi:MAG: hypothetical protein RR404_03325 [Bacilli bacterium]